jgi:hypothetical protein
MGKIINIFTVLAYTQTGGNLYNISVIAEQGK